MKEKNKIDINAQIFELLNKKNEINFQDVLKACGISKENAAGRKAISRMFSKLTKLGLLEAKGAARARVYLKKNNTSLHKEIVNLNNFEKSFIGVELTKASLELLYYIDQPIQFRKPVGYNQDFLRSYRPNETFYLDESERLTMLQIGQVEVQIKPAGTYARNILNRLLIELSWNSSRLEGNTYSILETKRLIELGEGATGKDATETQMILNHKGAIEYIVESAKEEMISSHEICSIHALLSENLLGDPSASGRLRQIMVGVGGTTYLPIDNPHLLKECFDLFLEKLNEIKDPFEQSFFSLLHLSYLQAFEDVNKRTARLVANIPLIKKNLNPLSFSDVNQDAYLKSLLGIYEKNDFSLMKDLYKWAYKRSCQEYSALQQTMGGPNLLKIKHRNTIHEIIQKVVKDKISGQDIVPEIKKMLFQKHISDFEYDELFKQIETEIISLHDGNIARFKIRPSEFQEWKKLL